MTSAPIAPRLTRLPKRRHRSSRLADLIALVAAVIVAFPLYWMVLSALKPTVELTSGDAAPFTLHPTFDAFIRVLTVDSFGRYFLNSLLVAAVAVTGAMCCAFLAAVALTRYHFRLRTTLLIVLLIAQMVPIEALTIPLFFMMRSLGDVVPVMGLNHLGSLMLIHIAFSIPLSVWMLRGFVAAVPAEVEEAARIDGASSARFVRSILFPLVAPGLVAVSIFAFISTWNDFLFAKTFIVSAAENQTLPLAILNFFKPDQNDWGAIMAGSVIMTLPVLVFFMFVQRRLVSGLAGAVKG